MLTTLRIRNLALVAEVTLELTPGLVVVTGETGAGKSIMLGALDLVLGDRADRGLIRSGEESCLVEAAFDVGGLAPAFHRMLEEHGLEPCAEGQLTLKRTLTIAGTNRQFVNGTPTSLQVLASVGDWLVDLHGPHEHQSLLHPARQLSLLDAYGNLESRLALIGTLVARRAALERQKAELLTDEQTYAQQVDLLRHQASEITAANLRSDEELALTHDYQRARNAARLLELSEGARNVLGEAEDSLLNQAGAVGRSLTELARLDPEAQALLDAFEQGLGVWRELQQELSHYADRLDIDPERLQAFEERLDLIHALKRKYGASLAEVIQFGHQAARRLEQLERRESELARLEGESIQVDSELWRAAEDLSARRRDLIPKLARAVTQQLGDLGFHRSAFGVTIASLARYPPPAPQPGPAGIDTVDFQFAPNPGEPAKPLRSIASSGELARVMLAVKTVLAAQDEIPVLIFDEVDANVGGETAHAVGEKMRAVARRRQVLCITHLPQVAAAADAHYVVTKEVKGGRTLSTIQRLEGEVRVTELARMLGGQSEAARRHALALLKR